MSYMFSQCEKLSELNLSSFNTKNVNKMSKMFYYSSKLSNLNLSSFTTNNVNNMSYMFRDCSNLKLVFINKLNIKKFKEIINDSNLTI